MRFMDCTLTLGTQFDGHAIGPWERNNYGQKFAIMLRLPHAGLFRLGFENAHALQKFMQLVFQLDEFNSLLAAESEFLAGTKTNSQTPLPTTKTSSHKE